MRKVALMCAATVVGISRGLLASPVAMATRGAFNFLPKPTTPDILGTALARIIYDRIRQLLEASSVQQLEDVTIVPGGDTPALKIGNVTVRVTGVYKEPRRDAMFLRVEVDGGREAFVKEVVSRFDESLVLAYPLTEGNRSIIALLVPAKISP